MREAISTTFNGNLGLFWYHRIANEFAYWNGERGKIMFCRLLLFLVFPLTVSCGSHQLAAVSPSPSPSPQPGVFSVLKVTENNKYQLEAIFSGEDFGIGDQTHKVIESLTVRSKTTADNVKYSREDGPDSDPEAYFTEVWSPDNEWLLLPLDRFSGFCIIRAHEAMATIRKQKCSDNLFTRLSTSSHELLWHDFEKWDGDAAFVFKAGLYGDNTRLRYDLTTGRLTVLDPNAIPRHIEGRNDKGKIAIVQSH